jgi:hypothetical protein
MEDEKDDSIRDLIKLFLQESLEQQKNEMTNHFNQIIQQLPTTTEAPLTSSDFGGIAPFQVHVNFDSPLFERKTDIEALETWLNLLSVHYFNNEKIIFALLKPLPHLKDGWDTNSLQHVGDDFEISIH